MTAPVRKSYLDVRPLPLILLFAALQLITALLTEGFTLSFDEAMWHYIGRNWFRHHLVPYSGGVDNKSPLIYAVFGLSDSLFGVNYWFPRILGTVCQSIGVYFVYKIARKFASHKEGVMAITLYGLSLLWRSTGSEYVSYTETYAIAFLVAAFYFYTVEHNSGASMLSGFLAGIAIGFRISSFFGMFAIAILMLKNRKSLGYYFLGLILAGTLFTVLDLLAGLKISEIWTFGFIDNFGIGSTTDHSFGWKLENFVHKFFYSELLLFYFPFAAFLLNKKHVYGLSIWLVLEFMGIAVPGSFSTQHLKSLLPPLSIACGMSITNFIQTYNWNLNKSILLIWIIYFPKNIEPLTSLKDLFKKVHGNPSRLCDYPFEKPREFEEQKLGLWIKSVTRENEKVLVAGYGARVQAYAERQSPTIYFNVTQTKKAKETFVNEVSHEKPVMILIPAFAEYNSLTMEDIRNFLSELVLKEYAVERCLYGYNVYRRK